MLRKLFLSAAFSTALLAVPAFAQEVSHDPATVQAGAYDVEPLHTRVLFSVSHLGFTTWYGEFTKVSGSLSLDPKSVGKSTLEIHIPVDSVSTSNAKVDGELKDQPWFDAKQFPEIVFKADKVTEAGKGSAKVAGTLTLHGVTKPVTLDVDASTTPMDSPMDHKTHTGFSATTTIKRTDFGIGTSFPTAAVGDDVQLTIDLEAIKQ